MNEYRLTTQPLLVGEQKLLVIERMRVDADVTGNHVWWYGRKEPWVVIDCNTRRIMPCLVSPRAPTLAGLMEQVPDLPSLIAGCLDSRQPSSSP